jgi:hypothetical protein
MPCLVVLLGAEADWKAKFPVIDWHRLIYSCEVEFRQRVDKVVETGAEIVDAIRSRRVNPFSSEFWNGGVVDVLRSIVRCLAPDAHVAHAPKPFGIFLDGAKMSICLSQTNL